MTLSQNVRAKPRISMLADTPVAFSGPLVSGSVESLLALFCTHSKPQVPGGTSPLGWVAVSPMALTADESLWQSEKFGVFKQNLWKVCLMWQNLHLGKRPGWGCSIPLAQMWFWFPCLSLLEGGPCCCLLQSDFPHPTFKCIFKQVGISYLSSLPGFTVPPSCRCWIFDKRCWNLSCGSELQCVCCRGEGREEGDWDLRAFVKPDFRGWRHMRSGGSQLACPRAQIDISWFLVLEGIGTEPRGTSYTSGLTCG